MIEKTNDNTKNTVELDLKWGGIIRGQGWTAVPNLLLKKQGELQLKAIELNVLLNLIRFWWNPDNAPFPSLEKMAIEMGISDRTVYRTISSLEENGFIQRIQEDGKTKYELSGLVNKLKATNE
jgi:biotin operon repressor